MRTATGWHKRLASAAFSALVLVTAGASGSARAATDEPARALADVGNAVYLPNVTKMLGGEDGWQTPFIVQNVGGTSTLVHLAFYSFADGTLVKTRVVPALDPGKSFFHDPNGDADLAAGGQYSVVIRSSASPVVALVNQHQNVRTSNGQAALSYQGLSQGSRTMYAPFFTNVEGQWLTTLVVQNLGMRPADVTLTFQPHVLGGTVVISRTIEPGRSSAIDPRYEPQLARGVLYGVTLRATQPIGVVVNGHWGLPRLLTGSGFSYNAAPANDRPTSFLPYIAKNAGSRSTSLYVQNSATRDITPRVLLCPLNDSLCAGGLNRSAPRPIPPGGVWDLSLNASDIPDGEYSVYSYSDEGE
ncbi:MAG TPA: hypothetical protein VFM93_12435, partial [Candidatus Limnocylindria bacterium]|nr:hypothetical protein [Candidatus Limnocylindria bacterium]